MIFTDQDGKIGMIGGVPDKNNDASVSSIESNSDMTDTYKTKEFEKSDSKDQEMVAGFSYKDSSGSL